MLKRIIKYKNFNDQEVSGVFYFNLSKSELVDLEHSTKEGFSEMLKRIGETEDKQQLIAIFKKFILSAYGIRSEDGERFIKNDQLREEFSQTAAYDALFIEMATDENAALAFISGVFPGDISEELKKQLNTPEGIIKRAEEAVASQSLSPPSIL